VAIADDGGSTASATSTATVADAALTAAGVSISATEGASTGAATVATFTDASPKAVAGDFTATINWGDGTSSLGTVSANGGAFTVNGAHSYADEGKYTVGVAIADDGGSTANATSTATVADADVLTGQGTSFAATANQPLTNVVVATFTDAYAGNLPSDFATTINWGDGTTTAGTVNGGNGAFTISGSHTYATAGQDTVTVTLSDDAPGTAVATAVSTVNVSASQSFTPGIAGLSAAFWAQHFLDWDGILGTIPTQKPWCRAAFFRAPIYSTRFRPTAGIWIVQRSALPITGRSACCSETQMATAGRIMASAPFHSAARGGRAARHLRSFVGPASCSDYAGNCGAAQHRQRRQGSRLVPGPKRRTRSDQ